ncbi:MAG: Na+/H+ antiporter NhaC family protein [Lachnospiraceae bacterium]
MSEQPKGKLIALLPIGIFLVIFLGSGCITGDFYSMPAIVAFLIALTVAFAQNREVKFAEKISIISKGMGEENIVTMCLIFLSAGAFSGAVSAAGGVESTVNLGLSILPSNIAVVGLFVIGCFISVSMGTSMGTIAAMAPIGVGISEKAEIALPICMGAIMCGAMFGDNLSMISDTTIAAVRTQGCEMKDKFRENFLIVLPAAIITAIIFLVISSNGGKPDLEGLDYQFIRVVPYLLVLIGALIGINVFVVLIAGTVLSLIVGLATGSMTFATMFQSVGEGVTGMYDITVISLIVAAIVALVKHYGGIQYILDMIRKRINSQKGGELGIAGLALLVDMCTANNTVAIVMAGPIAKDISEEFQVSPRRSASLLDIFASVGQGLIPYGAQLLSAAGLSGLTPLNIMPYLYYPILMAVSALCFIFFRKRAKA